MLESLEGYHNVESWQIVQRVKFAFEAQEKLEQLIKDILKFADDIEDGLPYTIQCDTSMRLREIINQYHSIY